MLKPLMEGKRGLIMGLANDKSIAWGIAQALNEHGAQLAISYQNEALEKRGKPLAAQLDKEPLLLQCDVSDSASMEACFKELAAKWGKIDFLVHAIAFSDKSQLRGRTIDTTRDNFAMTMNISCFSFLEACKYASPLMTDGGAVVTLTYMGAERVLPNYNIMGVAKAALEAAVRMRRWIWASKTCGLMRFRPDRLRLWRPRVSAILEKCCIGTH